MVVVGTGDEGCGRSGGDECGGNEHKTMVEVLVMVVGEPGKCCNSTNGMFLLCILRNEKNYLRGIKQ